MNEKNTSVNDAFYKIISNKHNLCSIAEKSIKNRDLISKERISQETRDRIHYFAIGHTFKELDTKRIFKISEDANLNPVAARFTTLQKHGGYFNFEEIKNTINNIRNLYSHFVHSFDNILIQNESELYRFVKESFELSALKAFNLLGKDESEQNKELLIRLKNNFALNSDIKNKNDALDAILKINNNIDFDWKLQNGTKAFDVKKGEYYSFYFCLFLLTMFLYKDEAELLISKISGFKKSKKEDKPKRDIFTFYAKKLKSMDIDSESSNLVKFREIIQYLNKYPIEWKQLTNNSKESNVLNSTFLESIYKLETERLFLYKSENRKIYIEREEFDKFFEYTKYHIWNIYSTKTFLKIHFTAEEQEKYNKIITTSSVLNGLYKQKDDKYTSKIDKEIDKEKKEDRLNAEEEIKTRGKAIGTQCCYEVEKVKTRAFTGELIEQYCRNDDKFLKYALRFLAENNYFGVCAKFKCYKYYTTEEQEREVNNKGKEEKDKLKYHKGRVIEYKTYHNYINNYKYWDIPFVIQNNSVELIMVLEDDRKIKLCIQDKLMPYLLEDCLNNFNSNRNSKDEDEEINCLVGYINTYHEDLKDAKLKLYNNECFEKKEHKLLPKRLLKSYYPEYIKQNTIKEDALLKRTIEKDKEYIRLLEDAKKKGTEDYFSTKNKGKQYKLEFVRKALNRMYFREIYKKQRDEANNKHHKGFNITRDDYNHFCKAMYLFSNNIEDKVYKEHLKNLFLAKKFFDNKEFEDLFNKSKDLNDLFYKTLEKYKCWVIEDKNAIDISDKYKLENYNYLKDDNNSIVCINLSHFRNFLKGRDKNKQDYKFKYIDENSSYLIRDYYLSKEIIDGENKKIYRKLYNGLNRVRLEDALLYEIACKYRLNSSIKDIKKNVNVIYADDIIYSICSNESKQEVYKMIVPAKDIQEFELWIKRKEGGNNKNKSYLENVANYLELINKEFNNSKFNITNNTKTIAENFIKNKTIKYSDLKLINSDLLKDANVFSAIWMCLEEYYLNKKNDLSDLYTKEKKGTNEIIYIKWDNIDGIKKYSNSSRNLAFHLGLPKGKSFRRICLDNETTFINEELNVSNMNKYEDLPKVCKMFLNKLHDNLINYKADKDKRNRMAFEKYMKYVIFKKKKSSFCVN